MVVARVNNVRVMLEIESLADQFMPTFLVQSAQPALTEITEAIKTMQHQGQPGNFDADFLEKYGDYLLSQGYPKVVVLRTWKLCEKFGPVPEGVAEKIQNLEPAKEEYALVMEQPIIDSSDVADPIS